MIRNASPSWLQAWHRTIGNHRLWFLAAMVAIVKIAEVVIDHQVIFFIDSGAYLLNAISLRWNHQTHRPFTEFFITYRSFVYGWLIRLVAAPFHSFLAVVLLQTLLGGVIAWLIGFMLMRYFRVRPAIALAAAIVFALDPVQVVHEHLVLPETTALFAAACFLVLALEFLETRALWLLVALAPVGVFLISLRFVYLPLVLIMAVLVPCGGFLAAESRSPNRRRNLLKLAAALCVSLLATAAMQEEFRRVTGYFAHREPGYNYDAGSFLMANVSSLVEPSDATDPRVQRAIAAQQMGTNPLTYENRQTQLWGPEGLVTRLRTLFANDGPGLDRASNALAKRAIRRNPLGFFAIGLRTYGDYWKGLSHLVISLQFENGMRVNLPFSDYLAEHVGMRFGGFDIRSADKVPTPSRRYHEAFAFWNVFLLLAWPFLLGLALASRPTNPLGVALLFGWSGMLMGATCLGSVMVYRYLQPFSLPAIVAVALLLEQLARTRHSVKA